MQTQKSLLTKLLMFIFLATFFFIQPIKALELTWDDPQAGTGIHVFAKGKDRQGREWTIREAQIGDIEFYQNVLADPHFVKRISGIEKPMPPEVVAEMVKDWVQAFAQGTPFGHLTILQGNEPVGTVGLRRTNYSGVGEIGIGLKPSVQSHGLGTEVAKFMIGICVPKARQIACGQDPNAPLASIDKFKFNGEPLKKLYAAISISNTVTLQTAKSLNFRPFRPSENSSEISCEGWDPSRHGPVESYIMAKHFSSTSPHKLQLNVLYKMIDAKGKPWTLSFSEEHQTLLYHFELDISSLFPCKDASKL